VRIAEKLQISWPRERSSENIIERGRFSQKGREFVLAGLVNASA
jgi:hypothetical protein